MTPKAEPQSSSPLDELRQENQALQEELAELRVRNQSTWALLVGISRRLQISSASIKAAVSSLLNYDIFWDVSAQHEFLETINSSADKASDLIMLVALAFRFEAGTLEMKPEPNLLQEILSVVKDEEAAQLSKLQLEIAFPEEGELVFVDYEYLRLAFRLLFEILAEVGPQSRSVRITAMEDAGNWRIDIGGMTREVVELLPSIRCCSPEELISHAEGVPPEILLKFYIVCHILCAQGIRSENYKDLEGNVGLRLVVPIASEKSK